MWVRSSKLTLQRPPPKMCTVMRLRKRSTLLMVPPTMVVVVRGTGGASSIGSWPSVTSAPEVAELSSMSVLGLACGIGVGVSAGCAEPFLSVAVLSVPVFSAEALSWSAALFCSLWFPGCALIEGVAVGCAGVVSGTVAEAGGAGVCGGAVFGAVIGVCGTPEPGFGV